MNATQRLARVFVELADILVAEYDLVDLLQKVTDRSVELLDADAAGLMLADQRGNLTVMAATVDRPQLLELFESQTDEGPALDCFRTGRAVTNVDLAGAQTRWPTFGPGAAQAGFGGAQALPLRLRDQVIGALNLLTPIGMRMDDDDLAIGQAMADIATIGLLHERTQHEQTIVSEQLQTALQSRILVEQAKGMVAARAGISITEAYTRIRDHARRHHLTLTAVATTVTDGSIDQTALIGH